MEDWKIRISALWFFVIVSDLGNVLMSLANPGVLEELMAGELAMGAEWMFVGAIVMLIPLVMAVLTLTLKGSLNRWLNIILGAVIAVIYFGSFVELAITMFAAHTLLLSIASFIAPVLIVWYAWKSKSKA